MNGIEYSRIKVIEECSELINELTDTFTKNINNRDKIVAELGDLMCRINIMTELEISNGDKNFIKDVEKAVDLKYNKIREWRNQGKRG